MSVNVLSDGRTDFYADLTHHLDYRAGLTSLQTAESRAIGEKSLMYLVDKAATFDGDENLNITQKIHQALGSTRSPGVFASQSYNSAASLSTVFSENGEKRFRLALESDKQPFEEYSVEADEPVRDFKNRTSGDIDEGEYLEYRTEKAKHARGVLEDEGESYAAHEFTKVWQVTEQMIRNDDRSFLSQIPRNAAKAARRTENQQCILELTLNNALSDGVALFHASHSNLISPGSAPSRTALKEMRRKLRVQTGLKSEVLLSYRLGVLLVPAALEDDADELVPPIVDPEQRRFKARVVADPMLDAVSESTWYGFADPSQAAAIEYCRMRGYEEPKIESWYDHNTASMMTSVSTIFGVKAVNFRPVVKNEGGA